MNYIVFDTETTGLGANAEVIQFSGLVLNNDFYLTRVINFYCYTQVPISEDAQRVHGISSKELHDLSQWKTFEDYFYKVIPEFEDVVWVGYNVSFDIRMVNNSLTSNGLPKYNFGTSTVRLNKERGIYNFDVMGMMAKNGINRKLSVAAKDLAYSESDLDVMYRKLTKIAGIEGSTTYHNSLFDAMITWLLLVQFPYLCL